MCGVSEPTLDFTKIFEHPLTHTPPTLAHDPHSRKNVEVEKMTKVKKLVMKYKGRVWLRMKFDGDTAKTTYEYVPKKPTEAWTNLWGRYNRSRKPRKMV